MISNKIALCIEYVIQTINYSPGISILSTLKCIAQITKTNLTNSLIYNTTYLSISCPFQKTQ